MSAASRVVALSVTALSLAACAHRAPAAGTQWLGIPATSTVRDTAVALVTDYFLRLERRDWRGASRLLDTLSLRATLDRQLTDRRLLAASALRPVPTADAGTGSTPSLTRAAASARGVPLSQRRDVLAILEAPLIQELSDAQLHALPVATFAALLLEGRDPRTRHLSLNRLAFCRTGASVRPEPWMAARVLGAVPVDDSIFFVAYAQAAGGERPRAPIVPDAVTDEPRGDLSTLVAVRTHQGWRLRHLENDQRVAVMPRCVRDSR
ncbi:MAG: hypothetical protein IPG88_01935 [Gemmatimonadetes bacterium]|nr:hypothetical protein [Gemmatimonadota bacterium]